MKVPFVDLSSAARVVEDDFLAQVRRVCRSGRFALGPLVEEFEAEFAAYCGVRHCVGLNSGTSALHLALRSLDIGPGDEVISVSMTFIATTWAISYVGATPVFVEIDPARRTLDPSQLAEAITPRTRAVIPVHLYGQPADMKPILEIAMAHNLPVVEDAAQAHGAYYRGQRVGGLGQVGCFSFYPSKNLGCFGEAGALVTNDDSIADRARRLRNHAQQVRYRHEELGYNYRMDALQAAALSLKLRHLDAGNLKRQQHARLYTERLQKVDGVRLPPLVEEAQSVFHLFVVELPERDRVAERLRKAGVETGLHYPVPVHRQPAYATLGIHKGTMPVTEQLAANCLSLPMFPELTVEQIDHVVAALVKEEGEA